MAKTPSLKQQLFAWADYRTFVPTKHSLLTDIIRDQIQAAGRWMRRLGNSMPAQGVAAVGATALLVWNWRLLLATGMGVGMTVLVYRSTHFPLRSVGVKLMRSLLDSPLLLALITGFVSVIISYTTLLVWQDTGQLGIALAVLLQGACTLLTIGLLLRQLMKPSAPETTYDQWVTQLMAPDPLQRLIAVRRLSQMDMLTVAQRQELSEYFQLLLAQELQPQIRDVALSSLKRLDAQAFHSAKLTRQPRRVAPQRQSLQRRIKVRKERVQAELEAHPEESWVQ
jgi:hypothetical protein